MLHIHMYPNMVEWDSWGGPSVTRFVIFSSEVHGASRDVKLLVQPVWTWKTRLLRSFGNKYTSHSWFSNEIHNFSYDSRNCICSKSSIRWITIGAPTVNGTKYFHFFHLKSQKMIENVFWNVLKRKEWLKNVLGTKCISKLPNNCSHSNVIGS